MHGSRQDDRQTWRDRGDNRSADKYCIAPEDQSWGHVLPKCTWFANKRDTTKTENEKMIIDKHYELVKWIDGLLGCKYQWGKIDCVSLAIGGIRTIFPDLFDDLNMWGTKESALREYTRHGSLVEYLQKHGWQKIPKNYVQSGDVIILDTKPMQTASVAIDGKCPLIDPDKGVYMKSLFELDSWQAFRFVGG